MMSHLSLSYPIPPIPTFVSVTSSNFHRKQRFIPSGIASNIIPVWPVAVLVGAVITCYGAVWPVTAHFGAVLTCCIALRPVRRPVWRCVGLLGRSDLPAYCLALSEHTIGRLALHSPVRDSFSCCGLI